MYYISVLVFLHQLALAHADHGGNGGENSQSAAAMQPSVGIAAHPQQPVSTVDGCRPQHVASLHQCSAVTAMACQHVHNRGSALAAATASASSLQPWLPVSRLHPIL